MLFSYLLEFEYNNVEKLKGLIPIFLDTNVWIDLCEKETDIIINIKNLLINLTVNNKIFCPLSTDTFLEFHKQTIDSIKRLTPLIDILSLNLSLIDCNKLYKLEVEKFFREIIQGKSIDIDLNDLFVPYACTHSKQNEITIPYAPHDPRTKLFMRNYNKYVTNLEFSDYINYLASTLPQKLELNNLDFQKEFQARFEICNGDKNRMREREQEYFLLNIIKPLMNEELLELCKDKKNIEILTQYLSTLNKPKYVKDSEYFKHLLQKSPMIKNTIEVMTFTGFDLNRKSKDNDSYDFNIMIEAMSYFNVLFTKDKWIISQLRNNYNKLSTKTKIIDNFEELFSYLITLN
jgi:hypothetical protein